MKVKHSYLKKMELTDHILVQSVIDLSPMTVLSQTLDYSSHLHPLV